MFEGKKVLVFSNGCPENRLDTQRMKEFFLDRGAAVTIDLKKADIIVFNACGHLDYCEVKAIELIKKIKRNKNPDACFIACGCFPKINPSRFREVYNGPTFGSDDFEDFVDLFRKKDASMGEFHSVNSLSRECLHQNFLNRVSLSLREKGLALSILNFISERYSKSIDFWHPDIYGIKISTGCLGKCSFCAVRIARGMLKSKSIDKILEEFDAGLKKGHKFFALMGTDIGCYGRDIGTDLVSLLTEIVKRDGDFKIKLRNFHPVFLLKMLPELKEILKSNKILIISTAAETASNRLLKLMNRGYTIEQYKKAILEIKKEFPDVLIRCQILIGLPTETEAEFRQSLALLDELPIDFGEGFLFQARPGTSAKEMSGQISHIIKVKRYFYLLLKLIANEKKRRKKVNDFTMRFGVSRDKAANTSK